MKTFAKIMAMVLALALTAAMSVGLTMAYLTDTDEDVNVMTLGNVKIEQIEQERDEDGKLVDFTQAKPAYPAVGTIDWADEGVEVNGTEYKVFTDDLKNVVDKIVTVKNTGKSDAFVRTIVVIEAPDYDPKNLIHVNVNITGVSNTAWAPVDINGIKYVYSVFTYEDALKPNEISAPSLVQVFLDSATTNEDVAKFGSTWEIFALSQAVQTAGFTSPAEALKAGFGDVTAAKVQEWFGATEVPVVVSNAEELAAAITAGEAVVLGGDIVLEDEVNVTVPTSIDLNGHKLTVSRLEAKADTTISNGEIVHGKSTYPALSVSAGTLTLNDVKVTCEEPCNVITSGSAEAAEYAALEIWSGKCVLNDCNIVAKATELRYSNSIFAVGIHSGELTMNGGSIEVESAGSTKKEYNFEGAIFAGSAGEKTVNLNDVEIAIGEKGKLLFAWGGNTVVNTTDAEGNWSADKVDARNGGTYEFK